MRKMALSIFTKTLNAPKQCAKRKLVFLQVNNFHIHIQNFAKSTHKMHFECSLYFNLLYFNTADMTSWLEVQALLRA